jgi:DNA-binding NarL/FixJ family response regulator
MNKDTQQLRVLVVDDHPLIANGTLDILQKHNPEAKIIIVQSAQEAFGEIEISQPNLVIVDLSIPEKTGDHARTETGIFLLKKLMENYPELNLTVQSSHVKALMRIKHEIDNHKGGFTVADKGLSTQELVTRIKMALDGGSHTKELKTELEIKPEWLDVLRLAFEEGLQDKAIATQMYKSERMIRHYWTKIQDALEIYPEEDKKEGKNIRALTQIRAKEEGLID